MTADTSRWAGVRGALGQRNYRLFFAGQLVSLIGTWTQSVAQTWLVYRLTGSPLWLGIMTFCQQAPIFFLATLGGSIADRYPRRRVLVVTQTAAMVLAFSLATLTWTGTVRVEQLLVLAAFLGVVNAVDIPTRQSFVIEMVGRSHLMSALVLNSSMVNGARILGPAIAGFAIKTFGEGWCFFVNGASFIAVIAGLLAMRDLPPPATLVSEKSALRRVLDGFRYVGRDERVRALLVLFAITSMAGMPYSTLMPIFASAVFHGDASTLGWLMGAAGIGALLGALTLASRRSIEGAFGWIGLACGVFGVTLVLFAWSRTFWVSIAILVPLGSANMVLMSATNTLLQTITPDALRGRVIAIWAMIVMGFAPFGSLLAGWLATALGPSRTLFIGGAVSLCAAATYAWWLRTAHPTTTRALAPPHPYDSVCGPRDQ